MALEELEKEIFDFIECKYKCKFKGEIKIEKNPIEDDLYEYVLNWVTDVREAPIVIYNQLETDEQFLEFIKKEIVKRNLIRVGYHKMVLEESGTRVIW